MSSSPRFTASLMRALSWRRLLIGLAAGVLTALVISPVFVSSLPVLIGRAALASILAVFVYGLFEDWPRDLPPWMARWALQVGGVVLAIPVGILAAYLLFAGGSLSVFWEQEGALVGFVVMALSGLIVAPLMVTSALIRQRDADAQSRQLGFDLEKSELERQALDARLHLLQAQVEPHFLFNTLANVRALVDAGSPQASAVLGHLIAYLRAAVPRLQAQSTTFGEELQLVKSYLVLMQLRMPDRLQFTVQAEPAAEPVACPPMSLMTLVENAVRHGIDPSEEGGLIEVQVRVQGQRCVAEVRDTGLGLSHGGSGLGTGLTNLRERLQLAFGHAASLTLTEASPHGVVARLDLPIVRS